MKFLEDRPIYKQIEEHIKRQIVTKNLLPGEKLPSVRQLAIDLTVNVNTIQRALSSLTDEEILETKRGLGNFVTEDSAVVHRLKEELIHQELERVYVQLKALELTDDEIIMNLTQFIAEKGEEKS